MKVNLTELICPPQNNYFERESLHRDQQIQWWPAVLEDRKRGEENIMNYFLVKRKKELTENIVKACNL